MLITKLFSEYPDFFSWVDEVARNEAELNFAGYKKSDLSAEIVNGYLTVTAENKKRGKKIGRIALSRGITEEDLVLAFEEGLLSVKLKEKPKEKKQLAIE